MRSLAVATLLAALVAPASAVIVRDENAPPVNVNNPTRHRLKRAVTADTSQVNGKAFDFVIAGGGVGGLAVAARLAEWKNVTVCVIEAGGSGDDVQQQIDVPGMAYGNSLTKGATDWGYRTVAQPSAGGTTKVWPRGKLLGGSGAVNGLFWGRASSGEYDAWASLNSGNAHNITWDWAEVNKYIMKSEALKTLPPQSQMDQFHIEVDQSFHGTDGPIHLGWSNYMYPMIENWVPTWEAMGLKNKDHAGGDVNGVTITPSTMFQDNQSRCDSMAGYIDPVGDLPNLVILTGQQVTSVVFNGSTDADGNNIASGVTFSSGSGAETFSVQANKEVILSGGTVGSAQILQLSGIGPQAVLQQAGVKVVKDLPVGYNLQDHVSATMYFNTQESPNWASFWSNQGAQSEALQEWQNSHTGLYTYINEAVGYVSMSDISGSQAQATTTANGLDLTAILKQVSDAHNIPANVQKGIAAQYELQKQWLTDTTGQLEIILTMWGQSANNNVGVQLGLQHPFSRGTIFISSNDPFTAPTINPDYFSVDIDKQVFNLGGNWIRRMMQSAPMSNNVTGESGATAGKNGTDLTDILVQNSGTEYHPQGTCAMMPEDQGGVVDTRLIVYGTSNIRVVDSSVIPIEISAHLMASTYGIAEKAADLIKLAYQKPPPPPESSGVASSTEDVAKIGDATDSAVAGAQKAGSGGDSNLSSQAKIGIGVGVGVGAGALLGALAFFFCLRRKSRTPSDEKGWYAAGPQHDAGAWDTQQAYREQESYSMGGMAAPRPNRFSSAHASISTMATADLQNGHRDDSSYSLGDYSRGGAASPYRDTPSPNPGGYTTPQFQSR